MSDSEKVKWAGNDLLVKWFGSSRWDYLGTIRETNQPACKFIFNADTNDDLFVRHYSEWPDAIDLYNEFIQWQMS